MPSDGVPVDVVDRQLWRDAQDLLTRHTAPGPDGACGACGRSWPCPTRRLAERANGAAFGSWNAAWTARHDLNSVRRVPPNRNAGSFPPRSSIPPQTFHPR